MFTEPAEEHLDCNAENVLLIQTYMNHRMYNFQNYVYMGCNLH